MLDIGILLRIDGLCAAGDNTWLPRHEREILLTNSMRLSIQIACSASPQHDTAVRETAKRFGSVALENPKTLSY